MFGVPCGLVEEYFSIPAEIRMDSAKLDPYNADGPFVLGTLLESLADPFKALNEGPHRVEVPDSHVYKSSRDAHSTFETRLRVRHKIPWIGLNGSVTVQLDVTCDTLETKDFDPDDVDDYIGRSLDSEPVKKRLDGKKLAELYMITGIEVAKGLRATSTTKSNLGSRFGPGTNEGELEMMPKMQNDVIVSYRAQKLTLFRPSFLNRWRSRDLEHGGWMIRSEPLIVRNDYGAFIKSIKKAVPYIML